jgi:hypothetical protein
LLALASTAYAIDIPAGKITITAQPVDYQAAQGGIAQATNKSYVANERFAILVSIDIPGYMDVGGLKLEVSPKNCTVDNIDNLTLATGDYVITGTTLAAGATVKITIKDTAPDTASTANELWAALYGDRTVSATATLGVTAAAPAQGTITIPKTGGRVEVGAGALCLLLAAALMWRRRNA